MGASSLKLELELVVIAANTLQTYLQRTTSCKSESESVEAASSWIQAEAALHGCSATSKMLAQSLQQCHTSATTASTITGKDRCPVNSREDYAAVMHLLQLLSDRAVTACRPLLRIACVLVADLLPPLLALAAGGSFTGAEAAPEIEHRLLREVFFSCMRALLDSLLHPEAAFCCFSDAEEASYYAAFAASFGELACHSRGDLAALPSCPRADCRSTRDTPCVGARSSGSVQPPTHSSDRKQL